jgi:hypothetical protein
MPTKSVMVTHHSHHGSAHNKSTILVVFANVIAPGLPIHRSTFSTSSNIGPALPTNLLVMAGIRLGRGTLLLPGSFGSTFRETIFLAKGYLLFVFLSFGSFG